MAQLAGLDVSADRTDQVGVSDCRRLSRTIPAQTGRYTCVLRIRDAVINVRIAAIRHYTVDSW